MDFRVQFADIHGNLREGLVANFSKAHVQLSNRTRCMINPQKDDFFPYMSLQQDSALCMQTCPCNLHPLTPHFYIVKLGFTGVYIIFLFLL